MPGKDLPRKFLVPVLAALALFVLNAWICRELFSAEFLHNLSSNEGAFVAISRFYRENFTDLRWFPWFDGGMPVENAYQPLLPFLAAVTGWMTGWSVERAFHFVLALGYALGPVTLFWFAWDWSKSLTVSLTAGLVYSLASFAELLIPVLRVSTGPDAHWVPLRLYNLTHYAEDPHILALTLLPLALLFLRRAMERRDAESIVSAVVFSASVVLTNAFGAVDLALGGICIALALGRGFGMLAVAGVTAYCWASPWLPPSLLRLITKDQWGARGAFSGDFRALGFVLLLLASEAAIWRVTRKLQPFGRFAALFAPWMVIFPAAYFLAGVSLVPQGNRYQLELELALSLVCGVSLSGCRRSSWRRPLSIAIVLLLLGGIREARIYRHYARGILQPLDITQTIESKTAHWLDRNLPGQRAMVAGDTQFLYNVFTDNPQMGGGHEPQVPNWMSLVSLYEINTGDGAGEKDGEISVFWLKAFGAQAIAVPGEKSRESYHPIARPHKFEGMLPVLWHEEDDTIYAVPQRSGSLAHVIPKDAVVTRKPIHGLDLDPARAYVAALDDQALPAALLTWSGNSRFRVKAPLKRDQVISVQMTWMPGWRASVAGREIPVHGDQLGQMILEPACPAVCVVEASYGVTTEAWICRILSGMAALSLLGAAFYSSRAIL